MTTAYCYSFSIRESLIRGKRPKSLRTYSKGPISPLSQKDIDEAIEFGKANKHDPNIIVYAFIFEKDNPSFLGPMRHIYVLVCTNYFLIAQYAASQTKNYDPIYMEYVNFLAKLPSFKVEVTEVISTDAIHGYPIAKEYVLLRNDEKVKASENMPLYNGASPYVACSSFGATPWQEAANKAIKENMEMAKQIAKSYQKDLNIDTSSGIPSVDKNVFDYNKLDLNSKYEVAVLYNDGEKRITIDFSKIK